MKCKMRLLPVILFVSFAMLVMPLMVSAEAKIDYSNSGYITILMKSPVNHKPVAGVGFELFYVGNIDESSYELSFMPAGDFIDSGVSFSNITASSSRIIAKSLTDYAALHGISGTTQTTGSDGKARFTSLQLGLYLLVPKNLGPESPYENLIPFLAAVPITDDEGTNWVYSVNVFPKFAMKPPEESTIIATTQETTTGDSGGLPQTGMLRWPVPLLSAAGILLFSFGWADMYIRRKNKHE